MKHHNCENLNWVTQNLRLGRTRPAGHGLDKVGLDQWSSTFLHQRTRKSTEMFPDL